MSGEKTSDKMVLDFWNERAKLNIRAGSNDLIAKQLEIDAISQHIQENMHILEVGCGNGITAIELARRFKVDITGIDFAAEMVANASTAAQQEQLQGTVRFQIGDVCHLPTFSRKFDLAFTERVLINLPDWPSQRQAIIDITGLLVDGGVYVMCENSQDGLDKINEFREMAGLHRITPPWHNRYLRDSELRQFIFSGNKLEEIIDYSGTYYFLSRVVNAWLAAQEGKEPAYDALVNQLALHLPSIGGFGQGRIWLWRKMGV